jgi:predicted  nucleic acid-binding Zn-ribbon protein
MQLRQAQSEAARAEAAAQALQARARDAQRNAIQADENARSLRVQSDQARQDAGLAKQNVSSLRSVQNLGKEFEVVRQQITKFIESPPVAAPASPPVVNAEGQTTGTVVNTTA